jgi:hypothetical protein
MFKFALFCSLVELIAYVSASCIHGTTLHARAVAAGEIRPYGFTNRPQQTLRISVEQFLAFKSVMKFNSRYTQNRLGDDNLLQLAAGNDTDPQATIEQILEIGGTAAIQEAQALENKTDTAR